MAEGAPGSRFAPHPPPAGAELWARLAYPGRRGPGVKAAADPLAAAAANVASAAAARFPAAMAAAMPALCSSREPARMKAGCATTCAAACLTSRSWLEGVHAAHATKGRPGQAFARSRSVRRHAPDEWPPTRHCDGAWTRRTASPPARQPACQLPRSAALACPRERRLRPKHRAGQARQSQGEEAAAAQPAGVILPGPSLKIGLPS